MKYKLFYKIFAIVFISVLLSHVTAGVIIGYFGKKNFHRYLENTKVKEFSIMAQNIGRYYEMHGGMEKLLNGEIPLHLALIDSEGHELGDGDMRHNPGDRPPHIGGAGPDKLIPGGPLREIFAIYDKDMNQLAGKKRKPKEMHIFPVEASGEIVAYLGALRFDKMPPNPFADKYIKSQMYLWVLTTMIVLVLVILTAVLLTRHILKPLSILKSATKKVAGRDFDVEVDVDTNDEFGDLACNFQQMIDTLKEYEQKQSRWISDISHELRTPLSVILGNIEAIQDGVRKPDIETIDNIYKNTMRMKRLVNELHDITLAESGVMHLQKVRVNIVHELSSLLDFYEVRMSEFNFRINYESAMQVVMVQADLMRMNQVFINILENTIKYAKSPGVLFVRVSCDRGVLSITFEDTGPGVEDVHLPYLFDRLYRVDSSRSSTTGGSGLGLSICKFIIENHGGEISAHQGEKGGLKLTIRLPLETEDE